MRHQTPDDTRPNHFQRHGRHASPTFAWHIRIRIHIRMTHIHMHSHSHPHSHTHTFTIAIAIAFRLRFPFTYSATVLALVLVQMPRSCVVNSELFAFVAPPSPCTLLANCIHCPIRGFTNYTNLPDPATNKLLLRSIVRWKYRQHFS